jgi:hypothetical protein
MGCSGKSCRQAASIEYRFRHGKAFGRPQRRTRDRDFRWSEPTGEE